MRHFAPLCIVTYCDKPSYRGAPLLKKQRSFERKYILELLVGECKIKTAKFANSRGNTCAQLTVIFRKKLYSYLKSEQAILQV